ncbi:type I-E CRISPR-associated protein Cse2/CasB [Streptomyces sp. NPDC002526]
MTITPPPATTEAANRAGPAALPIPRQSTGANVGRSRAFTNWVVQLCMEDPGARSALRSGLRKDLDSVRRMHRLVAPWLPDSRSEDVERAYYAVAAMIAAQPRSTLNSPAKAPDVQQQPDAEQAPGGRAWRGTSLGAALAIAVTEGPGREKEMRVGTAESRLNLLTRQSINGLHRHLPATVGYLCSVGVDIDWAQLIHDLSNWRRHSGRISRAWLQDFYRQRNRDLTQLADQADEQELTTDAPQPPAGS